MSHFIFINQCRHSITGTPSSVTVNDIKTVQNKHALLLDVVAGSKATQQPGAEAGGGGDGRSQRVPNPRDQSKGQAASAVDLFKQETGQDAKGIKRLLCGSSQNKKLNWY